MALGTLGSRTFAALTFGAVTLHGVTVTPPTPTESVVGGGGTEQRLIVKRVSPLPKYHPWIHFPKELEKELGEVPEKVVEAVVSVVGDVATTRKVQNQEPDIARAEVELKRVLEVVDQRWVDAYRRLLVLEYLRLEQEIEDAQIAMLLFEM